MSSKSPRFGDELLAAIEAAQRWAIHDPDPVTRGQIDALVDTANPALHDLFTGRLAFGTAGLRAEVGVGPNRMNALVVRQTSAAVVEWLHAAGIERARVVIGFDARHDSETFARHAAASVTASQGQALLADAWAPTPVFAHALLSEDADAAIVITASHNPPADNGYKLYLGDGLQIVPPVDDEIAERINLIANQWHERGLAIDDAFADLKDTDRVDTERWVSSHRSSAVHALLSTEREAKIVYTAMHGVGGAPIVAAFDAAGFAAPLVVEEQFGPDPNFPTVPFPNPEEPGAFDMAAALAFSAGADAALANDPDADRLAMAVLNRDGNDFVALSGNQLGALFADHVLRHTSGDDRMVARSVVSSRQLDVMAAAAGVHSEVTLTGFKWVARPIVTMKPRRFVFGFEEAIGYCIGDRVRDKDGVTAALVGTEIVAALRSSGRTVWDRLDELAVTHGVYANHPISVRFDDDPSKMYALMTQIETSPPGSLGGSPITDLGAVGLGELPATAGVHMLTADDTQVIVRPSGTEPKIKAYIEVIEQLSGRTVAQTRAAAERRLMSVVVDVEQLLTPG